MNPMYLVAGLIILSSTGHSTARAADPSAMQISNIRTLTIDHRYLNVPVYAVESPLFDIRTQQDKDPPLQHLTVKVDGHLLGRFTLRLADPMSGKRGPDLIGFIDLLHHQSKTLTLEVDQFPEELKWIELSDTIPGAETMYREKHRPQIHFSTKRGWINDPNGLIYHKGKYHLYYQYNPFSTQWGNMSWGHAVSTDLVHWEERPAVFYPTENGMRYSGACFIDRRNQLNLSDDGGRPIIAFYLLTGQGVGYSYSNDGGETFSDFPDNPVLIHPGERIDSPKPFWHEPTQRWVGPFFDHDIHTNTAGAKPYHTISIYSSSDLKEWKFESNFGDLGVIAECPDLIELPIDGNPDNKAWCLLTGDSSYWIGTFDGSRFRLLNGEEVSLSNRLSAVVHRNFYATQTFANLPESDGRTIQIGWMSLWGQLDTYYPGMPFNGQMSVPLSLSLRTTEDGPRLHMEPVEELIELRGTPQSWAGTLSPEDPNPIPALNTHMIDAELELICRENAVAHITACGVLIRYDAASHRLSVGDRECTLPTTPARMVKLRIIRDLTSIEVFGNGGRVYFPQLTKPMPDSTIAFSITAEKNSIECKKVSVYPLRSIWPVD